MTRTRSVGSVLFAAVLALLLGVPVAGRPIAAMASTSAAGSVDLAPAIAGDGTFVGAADLAGTVDTSAWTLVSDLAAGEPPRFAPAGDASAADGLSSDLLDATPTSEVIAPDGVEWLALGSNGGGNGALNSYVQAIAVWGATVYVGGWFTNAAGIANADYVARWSGSAWSALGSNGAGNGALNNFVDALAVTGTEVYVGGLFTNAAGIAEADYVARWSGSTWSALGSNGAGNGALNSRVYDLEASSNASGTELFVGGAFTNAGGVATADRVARWSASSWSALGSNGAGDGAINHEVHALAVSGSSIFVAGPFTNAGGIATADYVARWDGSSWSALGSNGAGDGAIANANVSIGALAVSGSDVYLGGAFTNAAGIPEADYLARWNGSSWSALGSNGAGDGALDGYVAAIAVVGSDVYVGGWFSNVAGNAAADYVARWNGTAWSSVGSSATLGNAVKDLLVAGSALYVAGLFIDAAGAAAADFVSLAVLPGPWSALGSNGGTDGAIGAQVNAVAVMGTDLYIGGNFTNAGGVPTADYLARWNGSTWSGLGSNGAGNGALNDMVVTFAVAGGDLYVGGWFTNVATTPEADYLARWNGRVWFAVGSNGSGNGALANFVYALEVSGGDLYVGGVFSNANGIPEADFVARWNGSTWSAVGSNGSGNGALNNAVTDLVVAGGNVFVGGFFTNAAGIAEADYIAKWNGAWSALGSNGAGVGAMNQPVRVLAVSGDQLYAGGSFTNAAGIPEADYVARWNSGSWSALGSNGSGNGALTSTVDALLLAGGDLYVGGSFTNAAGIAEADRIARWHSGTWSALGSNGAGNGALNFAVSGIALLGTTLFAGGTFQDAAGIPMADRIAAYGPIELVSYRPDGRIRKGTGTFVGNDIYNSTGLNQSKSGMKARGSTITFGISIQNDGSAADRFRVQASGAATTMYRVRYFRGTTEITAAVVAGTYQTPSLAPGGKFLIKAKVKVKASATVGSSVTRLVTISSIADPTKLDAVKFTGKRA